MFSARLIALALVAGCAAPIVVVPRETGVVRVFGGDRVIGHYVSPAAYHHYILGQLASLDGRNQEAADALRRALASDGESAYLRTRLAEELMALGRLDEARDELDLAMRIEPGFAEAHVNLGRVQVRLGDPAGAEQSFRRAIEVDRACSEGYLSLAQLYRDRGDGARADATVRLFAERIPESATARYHLAHVAAARGDLRAAEAELRKAVALDPSPIAARLELADLLHADGRSVEAAREYRIGWDRAGRDPQIAARLVAAHIAAGQGEAAQAILDGLFEAPGPAERRVAVGELFLQLRQPARAREIADAVLRGADLPAARLLRGRALAAVGQIEAAASDLGRVPTGAAEYPSARLHLARTLADGGRFEAAAAALQQPLAAGNLAGDDSDALTEQLARIHEASGDRAQALRLLDGALRARPSSDRLGLVLADLLDRGGEAARALDLVRALLRRSPDHVAALLFLGRVQARARAQLADAARTLERAFALRPTAGDTADALGWLHLQVGRLDDAQRLLERAERLAPDDPTVQGHLGDLWLRRDDRARALAHYRRALAARPDEKVRHAVEQQLLLLEAGRVGAR